MRNSRRKGKICLRDFLPGVRRVDVQVLRSYQEKGGVFGGWSPRLVREKGWFEVWLQLGEGGGKGDVEVRFWGWGQEGGG